MAGRPLLASPQTCAVPSGGRRPAPAQSFPKWIDAQDSTPLIITTARFCCPKLTLQLFHCIIRQLGFPGGSVVKNPPASAGDSGSIPGSGRSPWRRKWQLTPVFLPGESNGQRNLVGYSLWGCKEWDMTEQLNYNMRKFLS